MSVRSLNSNRKMKAFYCNVQRESVPLRTVSLAGMQVKHKPHGMEDGNGGGYEVSTVLLIV